MTITGRKVFISVYIISLVFHALFIGFQVSTMGNADNNYLLIAGSSIIAMTLILTSTKNQGEK